MSKQRIELTEQIVAPGPKLHGLPASERYERSRRLLGAILKSLGECATNQAIPLSVSEKEIANAVRKTLSGRKNPNSYSDAAEVNLSLAAQLWKARIAACGPPKASNEILKILMTQPSR